MQLVPARFLRQGSDLLGKLAYGVIHRVGERFNLAGQPIQPLIDACGVCMKCRLPLGKAREPLFDVGVHAAIVPAIWGPGKVAARRRTVYDGVEAISGAAAPRSAGPLRWYGLPMSFIAMAFARQAM